MLTSGRGIAASGGTTGIGSSHMSVRGPITTYPSGGSWGMTTPTGPLGGGTTMPSITAGLSNGSCQGSAGTYGPGAGAGAGFMSSADAVPAPKSRSGTAAPTANVTRQRHEIVVMTEAASRPFSAHPLDGA